IGNSYPIQCNDALELTRGPFAGTGETNCTASRRLHFASSGCTVGRGSRRSVGGRRAEPARSSATGVRRTHVFRTKKVSQTQGHVQRPQAASRAFASGVGPGRHLVPHRVNAVAMAFRGEAYEWSHGRTRRVG